MAFAGSERDAAQALAREWYRRQNDTGFAYQAGKKNFDTLVKEAEQQILGQKDKEIREAKESEAQLVKLHQEQIENLEKQRVEMGKEVSWHRRNGPKCNVSAIAKLSFRLNTRVYMTERARLETERARLAGIEARKAVLTSRLSDLHAQSAQLSEIGPQIEQLERTREIEETNYKYFQASLEKARIDEALDPSKMPNISVVQSPSNAFRTTREAKKLVLGLAGGGVALGLAFAFLIELVLDRSVKRPSEVETLLGIPLLLSIPYLNGRNPLRLRWPRFSQRSIVALQENGSSHAAPWESEHFMRPIFRSDSRSFGPLFRAQSDDSQAEACGRDWVLEGRRGPPHLLPDLPPLFRKRATARSFLWT